MPLSADLPTPMQPLCFCPSCGNQDRFDILDARTTVAIEGDSAHPNGGCNWKDDALTFCVKCGFHAPYRTFNQAAKTHSTGPVAGSTP